MMRTSNPAMNPAIFERQRTLGTDEAMSVQGTVNKCFILLGLIVFSAAWVWGKAMQIQPAYGYGQAAVSVSSSVGPYIALGGILGFILAMVTVFRLPWARYTAPAYALCEGLVLGGVSAIFEQSYPGIVMQAVALTFGTLFCMLAVYKSGMIKVTNRFIFGVVSATGAICLVYFASILLGFFGVRIPYIFGNGPAGILFSVFVVGIAALNLILDFHVIETSAQRGAPRYMEWYGAFALMVTLVWLYLEILRLLAKSRSRR